MCYICVERRGQGQSFSNHAQGKILLLRFSFGVECRVQDSTSSKILLTVVSNASDANAPGEKNKECYCTGVLGDAIVGSIATENDIHMLKETF